MAQTQIQLAPINKAGKQQPAVNASGGDNSSQEFLVSQYDPRYYYLASRGLLFHAYAAADVLSTVAAAMTGLMIWNGSSITSGVNAVLLKIGGMIIATAASLTSVVLATGTGQVSAPTGQTAATKSANNLITGAAPVCLALNAGTFTNAPTADLVLLHNTAAIAATGEDPGFVIDLEGSIIIPPQSYVCFAAVGAAGGAAGFNGHIMWAELPIIN
jgi:hypothetical protein